MTEIPERSSPRGGGELGGGLVCGARAARLQTLLHVRGVRTAHRRVRTSVFAATRGEWGQLMTGLEGTLHCWSVR